jgi:hypothetical protein
MDRTWGIISAANAPCTTRATTRTVELGASPHSAGGGGEADEADQEHATPAGDVPEPPAGDQSQREREAVAGDDPFQCRLACPEVPSDDGQRQRRDRRADEIDRRGEQQDAESDPAARIVGVIRARLRVRVEVSHRLPPKN